MRRRARTHLLGPLLSTAAMMLGCGDKTPPPLPLVAPPMADDPGRGRYIQRTMRALADSTPATPRTVKVLFYGQSITREPWTATVADGLRARFPSARLLVENRAIGGFAADLLVRTARADVASFHPDLIILHDLFNHTTHLDALVDELVSLSTAEIIVQTTHRRGEGFKATRWDTKSSDEYRRVAARHRLQVVDVRTAWEQFLDDNGLHPMALLRDEAGHLNAAGNALMAQLIARELVVLSDVPHDAKGISEPIPLVFDADGRATLTFTGARVEAVVMGGADAAELRVLVDGVAPSTLAATWLHGRVGAGPCADWPWDCAAAILVAHHTPLVDEEWTLELTNVTPDGASFDFSVHGSVTGPDGSGRASADFVSRSGRVVIAARDWWLAQGARVHARRVPPSITMRWRPAALHADRVRPTGAPERVVLVGGLKTGSHTLTLERAGEGALPQVTVTTFRPTR